MNNDKNIQPRNRNKANKDPLKGAPGHSAQIEDPSDSTAKISSRKASDDDLADENHKAALPGNIDEALQMLGSAFGEANVKKFRELLSSNAKTAESKVMDLIGSISGRPVASAAAVATGVGAIFLLREFLNRDSSPKKKIAGSDRTPSSSKSKSTAKKTAKSKSKSKKQSKK